MSGVAKETILGKWRVRIREKGDPWGRDNCLIHEHLEPVVEIYDGEQLAGSYYLSTFLEIKGGLDMCFDIPEWTLTADEVQRVIQDLLLPFVIARYLPSINEPAPLPVSETSLMDDMSSIKSLSDEILGA